MLLLVGAVRQRSWKEKLRAFQTGCCCNLLHTNTFHCPQGSVHTHTHTHKCVYTQAHACVHINTCVCPSENLIAIMFEKVFAPYGSDLLRSCCQTQTSKVKVWSPAVRRACTLSLRLVSWCQVGGSLCCLCVVHILSSLWAGMDYSWGIWVSQKLTTE